MTLNPGSAIIPGSRNPRDRGGGVLFAPCLAVLTSSTVVEGVVTRLKSSVKTQLGRALGLDRAREEAKQLRSFEFDLMLLKRNQLVASYPSIAAQPNQRDELRLHELKVQSQNGEDGILLHLFSRLGCGSRQFAEIGVQDGRECNAANLVLNFGWSGLMVEADSTDAASAREYYDRLAPGRVRVRQAFVTRENVEALLSDAELSTDLDLLSIDVDGVDYWIWDALAGVQPRVVAIEYNAYLPHTRPITVTYDPHFRRYEKHPSGYYYGASLAALKKLGRKKGYLLAGCDSSGSNAFFVREDAARGQLNDLSVEEAYYRLTSTGKKRLLPEEAFRLVESMEFATV